MDSQNTRAGRSKQSSNKSSSSKSSSSKSSLNKQSLDKSSSNKSTGQQLGSQRSSQISFQTADLACLFTKVTKGGKPALAAHIKIRVHSVRSDLSTLLYHAEALNLRLPLLRVSVQDSAQLVNGSAPVSHLFVLHGLFRGDILPQNISEFLNHLTRDFKTFLAYTQAHQIQLELSAQTVSSN